jgi:4'-phosphopantetheinyl transferase
VFRSISGPSDNIAARKAAWVSSKCSSNISLVPPHDVQVWYRATGALDATAIAAAVSVLSDEERAKYHRFRFARDARDYAAAHALLRATLSRESDRAPADWRFDKTTNGKPFLIGHGADGVRFSLSHASGMVASVVNAHADVGVDIECIDCDVEVVNIAGRFFAPAEVAQLTSLTANQQRDRFFDLWTLKEALSKALGVGMGQSLASHAFTVGNDSEIGLDAADTEVNLWQFGLISPRPRYRLAVAVRRNGPEPARLIFRDAGSADADTA